jgi:hypothetical protein
MIINRIWAENVLKYSHLEVKDIPAQGLIAISGENEAGKSTIGEIICFALFGRTFSLGPNERGRAIKWGESRCAATVEFTAKDGKRYRVSRFLDDAGSHGVSLGVQGKDEPIARGVAAVQKAITDLVSFGYSEFVASFYLTGSTALPRRESVTSHPLSAAVKTIAGISALEAVAMEAESDICREKEIIAESEREIADINLQISALDIQPNQQAELEAQWKALDVIRAEEEKRVANLEEASARNQDTIRKLHDAAQGILNADVSTFSYRTWQEHLERFASHLGAIAEHFHGRENAENLTSGLTGFAKDMKHRLEGFEPLRERGAAYRKKLAARLGESSGGEDSSGAGTKSFQERQKELSKQVKRIRFRRMSARSFMLIFLIAAAVVWVVWGLLEHAAEIEISKQLATALTNTVPYWETLLREWLLSIAVILTVPFILFWIRSTILSARITRFQKESYDLDQQLETVRKQWEILDRLDSLPLPEAVATLQRANDEGLSTAVTEFAQGHGAPLLDAQRLQDQRKALRELLAKYEAGITDMRETIARAVSGAQLNLEAHKKKLQEIDNALRDEKVRLKKADELNARLGEIEKKIKDCQRRINVRNAARELLGGACRYMSHCFNQDMRILVEKSLPLLTERRYERLQIDDNLTVRVFSREKQDFMEIDEISSGTQRQIMLAVRLALSQKLVDTVKAGSQFVFLDEAFAIFDRERTRTSLEALPGLSGDIKQIWLVAQELPENTTFAMHIPCSRARHELSVFSA